MALPIAGRGTLGAVLFNSGVTPKRVHREGRRARAAFRDAPLSSRLPEPSAGECGRAGTGVGGGGRYFLGGFSGPARERRASRPASGGCLPPVLHSPAATPYSLRAWDRSRRLLPLRVPESFFFSSLSRRGSDFLSRLPAARVTQADLTGAELPESFKRREHFCA